MGPETLETAGSDGVPTVAAGKAAFAERRARGAEEAEEAEED
jgi:hypothetical protein